MAKKQGYSTPNGAELDAKSPAGKMGRKEMAKKTQDHAKTGAKNIDSMHGPQPGADADAPSADHDVLTRKAEEALKRHQSRQEKIASGAHVKHADE